MLSGGTSVASSPSFVGSPLVCKSALLQYVRCTRVDYSNVGLDRFVSSRVEDDVRLESLLGFLAAQTRVLPRRHTVQASEAHEAALQHVVPRQFLRAVDGVFDSKSGPARATALCGHVRQALSSRVRHRERMSSSLSAKSCVRGYVFQSRAEPLFARLSMRAIDSFDSNSCSLMYLRRPAR